MIRCIPAKHIEQTWGAAATIMNIKPGGQLIHFARQASLVGSDEWVGRFAEACCCWQLNPGEAIASYTRDLWFVKAPKKEGGEWMQTVDFLRLTFLFAQLNRFFLRCFLLQTYTSLYSLSLCCYCSILYNCSHKKESHAKPYLMDGWRRFILFNVAPSFACIHTSFNVF